MDPLLMTLEDFVQRVAWPGDQPSPDEGGHTSGVATTDTGADMDYVADLIAAQGV